MGRCTEFQPLMINRAKHIREKTKRRININIKMKTEIIKINSLIPNELKIKKAGLIIKNGGLIAFPTETVYGLGANALNEKAVKKIFLAKGRPQDNPIIVHISKIKQLDGLVKNVSTEAKTLISAFWPGPLTIIMEKSEMIPSIVTCGLDTVAIRMPRHNIARAIIDYADCPIAAPSANASGRPSPTEAKHVIEDLFGRIDLIVDGGRVDIGIESTVIDATAMPLTILRPGMISRSQILERTGINVELLSDQNCLKPKSPGTKYRHYAPKAKVILIESSNYEDQIREMILGKKAGILCTKRNHKYSAHCIFIGSNPKSVARNIFASFRKLDEMGVSLILIEPIGEDQDWDAVRNRIIKSASQIIK